MGGKYKAKPPHQKQVPLKNNDGGVIKKRTQSQNQLPNKPVPKTKKRNQYNQHPLPYPLQQLINTP